MHTEYDLAQTLHRDRLRDAEEHRRWQALREEQKRRKAEAGTRPPERAPRSR